MSDERREIRAKIREYEKDGEKKNYYATIGTAWVSEHGSKIKVQLDTVPVNWDGAFFINKPYEKKDEPMTQAQALNNGKDVVLEDIDDKPIDMSEIPF